MRIRNMFTVYERKIFYSELVSLKVSRTFFIKVEYKD